MERWKWEVSRSPYIFWVTHSHRFSERLLVHGHLDGHVGQVRIHRFVRLGFDRRIVLRVLMVLSDGADDHADVCDNRR